MRNRLQTRSAWPRGPATLGLQISESAMIDVGIGADLWVAEAATGHRADAFLRALTHLACG